MNGDISWREAVVNVYNAIPSNLVAWTRSSIGDMGEFETLIKFLSQSGYPSARYLLDKTNCETCEFDSAVDAEQSFYELKQAWKEQIDVDLDLVSDNELVILFSLV